MGSSFEQSATIVAMLGSRNLARRAAWRVNDFLKWRACSVSHFDAIERHDDIQQDFLRGS